MQLVIVILALLLLSSGASAQWYGGWLVAPNWTWQSPSQCWGSRCTVPPNHAPYKAKHNVAHPSPGPWRSKQSSQQ
jgi:hypothetical protein